MAEFDFSNQIKARYTIMCDQCNKEMNDNVPYLQRPNMISLQIQEREEDGDMEYSSHHFCSKACTVSYLQKPDKS